MKIYVDSIAKHDTIIHVPPTNEKETRNMATLVYWKANIVNESDVYSIRAKTRKEALAILSDPDNASFAYESPVKVTIDYVNAFDLMLQCKGESFDNL